MMWSKSQPQEGHDPQAALYTHLLPANATGLWVFESGILSHINQMAKMHQLAQGY